MNTIEQVEQFWDQRPCNVKHSDHLIGSKEYFDQVEQRKFTAEPHILQFSQFEKWNQLSVLEIGCGIGTMAINFARNGANYDGVELSSKSLDIARTRFQVYKLQGNLYHGNAEYLQDFLPQKQYDLVFSWGVIHHTPFPHKIIEQIKKYIKPGGTLKIMVYAENSWKNFMIEAGLDQPEAQWGCPIVHTYNLASLQQLIGTDFEIEEIKQDHIFPYEIEAYKQKQYVLQPWFQCMPKKMFTVLEQHLGWHLMVTAKFKEAA